MNGTLHRKVGGSKWTPSTCTLQPNGEMSVVDAGSSSEKRMAVSAVGNVKDRMLKRKNRFDVTAQGETMCFSAISADDKAAWLGALTKAIGQRAGSAAAAGAGAAAPATAGVAVPAAAAAAAIAPANGGVTGAAVGPAAPVSQRYAGDLEQHGYLSLGRQ